SIGNVRQEKSTVPSLLWAITWIAYYRVDSKFPFKECAICLSRERRDQANLRLSGGSLNRFLKMEIDSFISILKAKLPITASFLRSVKNLESTTNSKFLISLILKTACPAIF